jgi:glutathione reductase (NADPH)
MASYDLIVLGGGSGGLATAQRAAEYGARAVVFEPARLGGTCVNVGCVPKKVMWNAAEIAQAIALAPAYGFDLALGSHDFGRLKDGRDAYVERLNGIYAGNLERKDIPVIRSTGRFVDAHSIEDNSGNRYEAPHIVIATGGYPRRPAIEGGDLGITSDGFFELGLKPRRVAVVGSGYIAVELGGVLQALGSEVSLFMRYDRLLRHFDEMLSTTLMQSMRSSGMNLVTGATPARASQDGELTLHTEAAGDFAGFDCLIWAIGRDPNTAQLGLEKTAVTVKGHGFIDVDEYQNTEQQGIYAVGDVTGQAELTPVAIAAGRRLADRLFDGQSERRLRYDLIPTVIFSHPPIGTIGLSERGARAQFGDTAVTTYTSDFVPMVNALTEHKPRTAMKLVVAGHEERIVGCHIIGPGADEMTQGFAVAMSMGATKRDFDGTIAIHPTSAEELVTMR